MSEPATAARVAALRAWAYDPDIPDDEWAGVTRPVFRAIEAAARDEMRLVAAMLDDELRRVEQGVSTAESLKRARDTYRMALSQTLDPD